MFSTLHSDGLKIRARIDAVPPIRSRTKRSDEDIAASEVKIQYYGDEIKEHLDVFVQCFINAFLKSLVAYHITAKGERLTEDTFKAELKVGLLLDLPIAQIGLSPTSSLINFMRTLSCQYYSREKAQRITKAFENISRRILASELAVAGIEIFQSFESQFMHVTDKAGDKMAMEKLAEDAAGRALNYIAENSIASNFISSETISKAVILGK